MRQCFQSNRSKSCIVSQLTGFCDCNQFMPFWMLTKAVKTQVFLLTQSNVPYCSNFCTFYFSHIHAEQVQNAPKSVSHLHAKCSAWWSIQFDFKNLLDLFCLHCYESGIVRNLSFKEIWSKRKYQYLMLQQ